MHTTTQPECPSNRLMVDEQSSSYSTEDGESKTNDGQQKATTEATQLKIERQTSALSNPMSENLNHLFMQELGAVKEVLHKVKHVCW